MSVDSGIIAAIIAAIATIGVAVLAYLGNKKKEREAEWRKFKLDHYKDYVQSLSAVVADGRNESAHVRYANAANFLTLVAPPDVIEALYRFQDGIRVSNQSIDQELHDTLLTTLLIAIRRDTHPKPPTDDGIKFRLFDIPRKAAEVAPRQKPIAK